MVAQPRRVAARAAAHRMAALLGEQVGGQVGYAVRGERRAGPRTRVEVVTTGLLVQRLQHDPELAGIDAVLLDECHERHLDSDLALAFAVEVRAALRPDLLLLAMSATVEADRLAALLGGGAARPRWSPPSRRCTRSTVPGRRRPPGRPPHGLRVDPRLLDHVAGTVRRAVDERDGDLLVFLPGAARSPAVTGRLAELRGVADVVPLHGRQAGRDQDAALRPAGRRRVVLATAVAESSLTVPGVRVVVDAGLSPGAPDSTWPGGWARWSPCRCPGPRPPSGPGGPGGRRRAGCTGAGPRPEHERLPAYAGAGDRGRRPDPFALQLACWGHPDGTGLALPDPPPDAALRVARGTLTALGALGLRRPGDRRGAGPSPGSARIPGWPGRCSTAPGRSGADRAAEVVALLSEDSTGPGRRPGGWLAAAALRRRPGRHRTGGAPRSAGCAARSMPSVPAPPRSARDRSATERCPTTWPRACWSGSPTRSGWPGSGNPAAAAT